MQPEYSDVEIRWEGQDGSLNTDWINSNDVDFIHYVRSIQSYGATNIRVFYGGVEIDNNVLHNFSNKISGVSASFSELVQGGRASTD